MNIFILEDDPIRMKWFHVKFKGHEITSTASAFDAISILNSTVFDFICLDHDLCTEHYAAMCNGRIADVCDSGYDVAIAIPKSLNKNTPAVIHSLNLDGARRMQNAIGKTAVCWPFGSFGEDIIQKVIEIVNSKKKLKDIEYPVVSIIIPAFNSNTTYIKAALDSIKKQTYKNIEVIVVDDASTNKSYFSEIEKEFIQFIKLAVNQGTAGATTEGIHRATGKYIGILDHDDMLHVECIVKCVNYLENNKDKGMVYTDNYLIHADGSIKHRIFKEDFNDDLLLSMMYINHFRLCITDLAKEFLPLRYSGAQDYDFTLKFAEKYKIGHLRELLYGWRCAETSTNSMGISPLIEAANMFAITDAVTRRGLDAEVMPGVAKTHWHIDRKLKTKDLISIIIITKDNLVQIRNCVDSILKNADYPCDIIIADTGTKDLNVLNYYKEANLTVVDASPYHFSKSNNKVAALSKNKYLLFLNNDTVVFPNWLSEIMKQLQRPEVGIVGSKLLYPNGTIQHAGVALGMNGIAGHMFHGASGSYTTVNYIREVSAVTGACLAIKRDVFEQVGGFNEKYDHELQDIDLCLACRKIGYKVIYTPYSVAYHICGHTRGIVKPDQEAHDRPLFVRAWYDELKNLDMNICGQQMLPNDIAQRERWAKMGTK